MVVKGLLAGTKQEQNGGQHPTLMEVRSVTPGWDSPSASALRGQVSPEQGLVPRAGLVVVHMRDLSSTCLGAPNPSAAGSPNSAAPWDPRFTKSCLAARLVHCRSGELLQWLCLSLLTGSASAGAAAGTEHGEAPVPRDTTLLPVHHQAGECKCPSGAIVGLGKSLEVLPLRSEAQERSSQGPLGV